MPKPLRALLHALKTRPRLIASLLVGLLVATFLPLEWAKANATRFLIAWNVAVILYLFLVAKMVAGSTPVSMQRRAITQAESQFVELILVLLATLAALIAIFVQLTIAKGLSGEAKSSQIALAALTILCAWLFIHTMFALHYAHDYFETKAHGMAPGLTFPGTADPEYGDFFYCAFIIGTSGQTADVSFTNKTQRRIALVHSVLSFLFNTTMLAMTINIAAGFL
jgi:uncharacterized membrane protein